MNQPWSPQNTAHITLRGQEWQLAICDIFGSYALSEYPGVTRDPGGF